MSTNLSEHARLAQRIGLPQVSRPQPPPVDPTPTSPAGSLFDGSDDEDPPDLDLGNSQTGQSSGPKPSRVPPPNLKDVFPKPDASFTLGPPTASPGTASQVRAKRFARPAAGVIVLNRHACKGQSVWTSSTGAPNVPEAVQARTAPTAQPRAPARPAVPVTRQGSQPTPGQAPPSAADRQNQRPAPPAQGARPAGGARATRTTTTTEGQAATPTTQEQAATATGTGGAPTRPNNPPPRRLEWEWDAPPDLPPRMMVYGPSETRPPQVPAHTRGSRGQRPTGAVPVPNPAPAPGAGAPTAAARLVRTHTAPPTTRPSPATVPTPTGQPARGAAPAPSVRRTESIPTRPPRAPTNPRWRPPGPSTTTMQQVPQRVPVPQPTTNTRIFTPHELSAIALARAAANPPFVMDLPPMMHISPQMLTLPYMAPPPLPTVSGTSTQPAGSQAVNATPNQTTYNEGIQGVPVGNMYLPSPGPSGNTSPSAGHYVYYPPPIEFSATPTASQVAQYTPHQASNASESPSDGSFSVAAWMQGGSTIVQPPPLIRSQSFNGFSTPGASTSNFSGAYIPPPPVPGSISGTKRPAEVIEILDDEVPEIPQPSQSAKRSKHTHE